MLILPCTPAMAFPPSFRVIGPIYHELKLQTFSSYKLIVSDVASLWLGTVFKVDVRGNSWPCFRVRCCFLIWGAHRADWTPFLLSGSPECPDTPRKLKVQQEDGNHTYWWQRETMDAFGSLLMLRDPCVIPNPVFWGSGNTSSSVLLWTVEFNSIHTWFSRNF